MSVQGKNEGKTLEILNDLLDSINLNTEFILRASKTVKPLRGSKVDSVAEAATRLVKEWKVIIAAYMHTHKKKKVQKLYDKGVLVEEINGEQKVLFYSGNDNKVLSNLWGCKFPMQCDDGNKITERIFPSSEHAYVATRFPRENIDYFTVGGVFSSFSNMEADFNKRVFDIPKDGPKRNSWKETPGIIPKMLCGNSKWARVVRREYKLLDPDAGSRDSAVWHPILLAKFGVSGSEQYKFLRNTGEKHLVEFDRGALKHSNIELFQQQKATNVIWGAAFDKDNKSKSLGDIVLIGSNIMGDFISDVRGILFHQ